jgi:ribose-phosphate pyrophosphokinase
LNRVTILDNSYFIEQVISKIPVGLEDIGKDNHLILMSTDAGGFKPLIKLCDKIGWKGETFSASKSRKYEDGKSVLTQQIDRQDFRGKDILIIDDICVKGETFVGLAKMLKERNAGKLYLAISHLTVPNPNPELVGLYDTIFTTNSKGIGYNVSPIEILPYKDIN